MKRWILVCLLLPALLGFCLAASDSSVTNITTPESPTSTVATTSAPPTTTAVAPTTTAGLTSTAPTTQGPTTATIPPTSRATTASRSSTAPPTPTPKPTPTANSTLPATSKASTSQATTGGSTGSTGGAITTTRPTTLPRTTPSNPPTVWEVLGGPDNSTCQKMQFNADITATYYDTNNTFRTFKTSVPRASNATGDCSSAVERSFSLTFVPRGGVETWKMSLFFTANKTSKVYQLASIGVKLSYGDLVNSTEKGEGTYYFTSSGLPLAGISAPSGKSFACDSARVQSTEGKDLQLSVALAQLRLQPFANEADGDFGESVQCPYPTAPPRPPATKEPMASSWMHVAITFIVLFIVWVIATVAFCVYVKKHKAQSADSYSLMETY